MLASPCVPLFLFESHKPPGGSIPPLWGEEEEEQEWREGDLY